MKALTAILCVCVCLSVVPVASALDDPDTTFQVQWAIFIPASTYFLGETISFRVEAFASTDSTLKIPDQYAHLLVRNESHLEVWDTWIVTDTNGSAWVEWDTELDYSLGNYTVFLEDGFGYIITISIMLLFDENTYWQKRLSDLQEQIDIQNDYFGYLFDKDTWTTRKLTTAQDAIYFLSIGFVAAFIAAVWVAAREYIRMNARLPRNLQSGIADQLGLRAQPFFLQTRDHPEAANYIIPPHHKAPRFGEDYYCPLCEKGVKTLENAKLRMTRHQWEEHMQDFHERKLRGLRARLKMRGFKRLIGIAYPEPDVKPVFECEKPEVITRELLLERAEGIRRRYKAGKLSEAGLKAEALKFRFDAEKAGLVKPEPKPVYKKSTSAKHEKSPQPQEESARKPAANGRSRKVKVY